MVERDRPTAPASEDILEANRDDDDAPVAAVEPVSTDDGEGGDDPLADVDPSAPDEVNPADLIEQRLAVPLDDDDYR